MSRLWSLIQLPTKRNKDSSGKWPISDLEQEMYNMSWNSLCQKVKNLSKTTRVLSKDLGAKLKGPYVQILDNLSIKKNNYSGLTYIKYITMCKIHWSPLEDAGNQLILKTGQERLRIRPFIRTFLLVTLRVIVDEEKFFFHRRIPSNLINTEGIMEMEHHHFVSPCEI